jgi:hypothetical protein
MKAILCLVLFGFSSISFANNASEDLSACEVPSERFLRGMLHEGGVPTKWRTVKGKSYDVNRSVNALGVIGRTQESSYAIYKGKKHTAEDIIFCKTGGNKLRATHPEHGSINLTRTGTGIDSMLSARWGIFRYNLRLDQYVQK